MMIAQGSNEVNFAFIVLESESEKVGKVLHKNLSNRQKKDTEFDRSVNGEPNNLTNNRYY